MGTVLEGKTTKATFELEKNATKITGILFATDADYVAFYRATFELHVGGRQIFDEGFHMKLMMAGLGVPPKDRFFPLNVDAGNGHVDIAVTDNAHSGQAYAAYVPSMYLEYVLD